MTTKNLKNEIFVKEEIVEEEEEEMRIDEDGKLKKRGEGERGEIQNGIDGGGILGDKNTKITSTQTATNGRPPRKNGILFAADGPSNNEVII